MDITPLIPDGHTGAIKRLQCTLCKHMYYLQFVYYQEHLDTQYCHECSLAIAAREKLLQDEKVKVRQREVREELTALFAAWDEEDKDTPIEATIRNMLESARPGFKMFLCIEYPQKDGKRSWEAMLTKTLDVDEAKNIRTAENVEDAVFEMSEPGAEVPFLFAVRNILPPRRFTVPLVTDELRTLYEQLEEIRVRKGRNDITPFI